MKRNAKNLLFKNAARVIINNKSLRVQSRFNYTESFINIQQFLGATMRDSETYGAIQESICVRVKIGKIKLSVLQ